MEWGRYLRADDAYIKVLGKGDKWREVGLGKDVRTALHRYLTRYRKACATEQHVFLNRYKQPLTISGLEQIIYKLGEWARVKGVRCSPHTFRHTFAVNYLKATGNIYNLSRIMGHSSVEVTEGYLKTVKNKEVRNSVSVVDSLEAKKQVFKYHLFKEYLLIISPFCTVCLCSTILPVILVLQSSIKVVRM